MKVLSVLAENKEKIRARYSSLTYHYFSYSCTSNLVFTAGALHYCNTLQCTACSVLHFFNTNLYSQTKIMEQNCLFLFTDRIFCYHKKLLTLCKETVTMWSGYKSSPVSKECTIFISKPLKYVIQVNNQASKGGVCLDYSLTLMMEEILSLKRIYQGNDPRSHVNLRPHSTILIFSQYVIGMF